MRAHYEHQGRLALISRGETLNCSSRLIAAAVSLVGSPDDVRSCMQCTEEDFLDYCAGDKEPSSPEFDRLVSLIVQEQGKIIAENRELLRAFRERRR